MKAWWRTPRSWSQRGLAGAAACCAGLVLLLLVFWRTGTKEEPPVSQSLPSPEHHILIRPLVAETPAAPGQPPPETVSPDTTGPHSIEEQQPTTTGLESEPAEPSTVSPKPPPPVEQPIPAASSQPTLKLGVLQIESSDKSHR